MPRAPASCVIKASRLKSDRPRPIFADGNAAGTGAGCHDDAQHHGLCYPSCIHVVADTAIRSSGAADRGAVTRLRCKAARGAIGAGRADGSVAATSAAQPSKARSPPASRRQQRTLIAPAFGLTL